MSDPSGTPTPRDRAVAAVGEYLHLDARAHERQPHIGMTIDALIARPDILRELAGQEPIHEVVCPSCSTTIRARMADSPASTSPSGGEPAEMAEPTEDEVEDVMSWLHECAEGDDGASGQMSSRALAVLHAALDDRGTATPAEPSRDDIAEALHRICTTPVDYQIGMACTSASNHSQQADAVRALLDTYDTYDAPDPS